MAKTIEIGRREFLKAASLGTFAVAARGIVRTDHGNEFEHDARVEVVRKWLDGAQFRADNTPVVIQRFVNRDPKSEWGWALGEEETLILDDIDFSTTKVSTNIVDGICSFDAYIPNMTGGRMICRVPIGQMDLNKSGFSYRFSARPARTYEQVTEPNRPYFAYACLSKDAPFYDNKFFNILQLLNQFRYRSLEGFGPSETFSYLDTSNLGNDLRALYARTGEPYFYLTGFGTDTATGGVLEIPAGGACESGAVLAKTCHKGQRQRFVEVFAEPHSNNHEYFVNPLENDTIDATIYYDLSGESTHDVKVLNTSKVRLYLVPQAHVVYPEMKEGQHLKNSLERGATVWLAVSIALTDIPPSIKDSESVENSLREFVEYRKKYGLGPVNGFNN